MSKVFFVGICVYFLSGCAKLGMAGTLLGEMVATSQGDYAAAAQFRSAYDTYADMNAEETGIERDDEAILELKDTVMSGVTTSRAQRNMSSDITSETEETESVNSESIASEEGTPGFGETIDVDPNNEFIKNFRDPSAPESVQLGSTRSGAQSGVSASCQAAQDEGSRQVAALPETSGICDSAKIAKRLGEIMVQVGQACNNAQAKEEGSKMIKGAEGTMAGSCSSY